jgi:hypothetical protein
LNDIHKFLEDYITAKGYNVKSFEAAAGLGNGTIGTSLKNKSKFRSDTIQKIVKFWPDLDQDYFKGKSVSPFKNANIVVQDSPVSYGPVAQLKKNHHSIEVQLLEMIEKELVQKNSQIENLTKVIFNLTAKGEIK